MSKHVLVPVDGSILATQALDHALCEHADATVTVLHVIDPLEAVYQAEASGPVAAEEWLTSQREASDALLDAARERAVTHDATVQTATRVGKPARIIVEYVVAHDIDHVVLGSHGRSGAARLVLGSVAESVVRQSPVPVTIVR